jgi:aminomethyltransferase
MEPKRTPLFEEHKKLGAKFVSFSDWEMPLQYTGIIDEHINIRNNVGIFDVSHMGEIEIHGKGAADFVDYLVTNSVKDIKLGRVKYSPMCYPDGGEVDDLFVYKLKEDFLLLVVNASNYDKDLNWAIDNKGDFDVEILGKTYDWGEIAIQGPKSEEFLISHFEGEKALDKLGYFQSQYGRLFGKDVLISRTGYTGEDGFEVYSEYEGIIEIWRSALDKGKSFGIKPAGLGARDTLRFEVGYWLYGNDIDKYSNPFEAGQDFAVKLDKKNFIGKSALLNIKESGLKRKLIGLHPFNGGIPRHGEVIIKDDTQIGFITSGNFCPSLNEINAMAYVQINYAAVGTQLELLVHDKLVKSEVINLPFVMPRSGKKKV